MFLKMRRRNSLEGWTKVADNFLQRADRAVDDFFNAPIYALRDSEALKINEHDDEYSRRFKNVLYAALNPEGQGIDVFRAYLDDQTLDRSPVRNLYTPAQWGKRASFNDILGANFRRHNDVWNLFGPNTKGFDEEDDFSPEMMWEVYNQLQVEQGGTPLPKFMQPTLESTESRYEWLDRVRKMKQEMIDQRFLNTVPFWDDFFAAAAATFISPISVVGGAQISAATKGVKSVAHMLTRASVQGATWGTVQAAAQEAILFGAQDMRTVQESLWNVGGAAFFGALLGPAISSFSLIPAAKRAKMANVPLKDLMEENTIIPGARDDETAIRAQRGIISKIPFVGESVEDAIDYMAPNIRTAHNRFSKTMTRVSLGLSSMSGANIEKKGARIFEDMPDVYVGSPGGDVESLSMIHYGDHEITRQATLKSFRALRKRLGRKEAPGWMEFKRETFKTVLKMSEGQPLDDVQPEMQAAAKVYEDFYLSFYRQVKQIEEETETLYKPFENVSEAQFIQNFARFVDKTKVNADPENFKALLRSFTEKEIRMTLADRLEKVEEEIAELDAEAELIGMDTELAGAEILKKDIELMELPHQMGVDLIVNQIEDVRSQARSLQKSNPDEAKKLWEKARDLDSLHSEVMEPYKAKKSQIQRGRRALERSSYGIMREQQKVTEQIEAVEEALTNSLGVFERNIHKFLSRGEKFSAQAAVDEFARLQSEHDKINRMIQVESNRQRVRMGLQPDEVVPDEVQQHLLSRLTRRADLVDKLDEVESTYQQKRDRAAKLAQEARDRVKEIALARGARREQLRQELAELDPTKARDQALGLDQQKRAELNRFREWAESMLSKKAGEPVEFRPDEHDYGPDAARGFRTREEAEAYKKEKGLGDEWQVDHYMTDPYGGGVAYSLNISDGKIREQIQEALTERRLDDLPPDYKEVLDSFLKDVEEEGVIGGISFVRLKAHLEGLEDSNLSGRSERARKLIERNRLKRVSDELMHAIELLEDVGIPTEIVLNIKYSKERGAENYLELKDPSVLDKYPVEYKNAFFQLSAKYNDPKIHDDLTRRHRLFNYSYLIHSKLPDLFYHRLAAAEKLQETIQANKTIQRIADEERITERNAISGVVGRFETLRDLFPKFTKLDELMHTAAWQETRIGSGNKATSVEGDRRYQGAMHTIITNELADRIKKTAEGLSERILGRDVEITVDRILPGRGESTAGTAGPTGPNTFRIQIKIPGDKTVEHGQTSIVDTTAHEALHAADYMGLISPEEWGILFKQAEDDQWLGKYFITGRYPHLPRKQQLVEAVSFAFGEYAASICSSKCR